MIYLSHFGLREPPFGITPDTSFFYACASSQEALNTLLVAVANGEGFLKITGEVGTGKTLLCRKFLATLDDNWVSAYVPSPNLEPARFDSDLRAVVAFSETDAWAVGESGLDQEGSPVYPLAEHWERIDEGTRVEFLQRIVTQANHVVGVLTDLVRSGRPELVEALELLQREDERPNGASAG